ncbi:MAG: [Fe-Fe] hydrogenase large subunit C-terminal domain-containing protein [Clostridia bacterium]|jgi:iron only hydrogenase large subunit-like protein
MTDFYSLYDQVVKAAVSGHLEDELEKDTPFNADPNSLDCLLNPEKCAPVINIGTCRCSDEERCECEKICFFDAIRLNREGNVEILSDKCIGCGDCIEHCKYRNLIDRKDIVPLFRNLYRKDPPVYAMIAPAFIGQFSDEVTPGKLRSAFKRLGFAGMIEVALFADILTLKEALEFDRHITTEKDFMLTSCCCPIWIAMIRKVYSRLIPHMPPSVSPMVACGRAIKKVRPGAITVFVGPCVAKKAEAREPDIKDSVDYVMTFEEVKNLFDAAGIDPAKLPEDQKEHSSKAGRIYARTKGVSTAVKTTLEKLKPDRKIPFTAAYGNGVRECKALLNDLLEGNVHAGFIEGMGCVGGCVGGPKAILDKEQGTVNVDGYGDTALYETPAENPHVIELLHRLGFDTIDSLLEKEHMFVRNFTEPKGK